MVINCGAAGDQYFSGGDAWSTPPLRFGQSFRYSIPLVQGFYSLVLKFEEPSVSAVGARVFSVWVNNSPLLQNLDIYAEAKTSPLYRGSLVHASGGKVNLEFRASVRS